MATAIYGSRVYIARLTGPLASAPPKIAKNAYELITDGMQKMLHSLATHSS